MFHFRDTLPVLRSFFRRNVAAVFPIDINPPFLNKSANQIRQFLPRLRLPQLPDAAPAFSAPVNVLRVLLRPLGPPVDAHRDHPQQIIHPVLMGQVRYRLDPARKRIRTRIPVPQVLLPGLRKPPGIHPDRLKTHIPIFRNRIIFNLLVIVIPPGLPDPPFRCCLPDHLHHSHPCQRRQSRLALLPRHVVVDHQFAKLVMPVNHLMPAPGQYHHAGAANLFTGFQIKPGLNPHPHPYCQQILPRMLKLRRPVS
ncbi:MAG: hypothetical protein BWY71_02066 [Planctomycetes bacterium ADurb.Bin412]|nr:MAG: hypothetical protein BWY71_02066 [Planctomycetes bacterium ADurb.Bin412]